MSECGDQSSPHEVIHLVKHSGLVVGGCRRATEALLEVRVARWEGCPASSRGVSDRIGCPDHAQADSRGETPMESALVATQLHVPAPRSRLMGRARLIDRLERGLASRLVLVSAPAGFGKTSLLTQWLAEVAGHGHTVAWLALDQSDNRAHT